MLSNAEIVTLLIDIHDIFKQFYLLSCISLMCGQFSLELRHTTAAAFGLAVNSFTKCEERTSLTELEGECVIRNCKFNFPIQFGAVAVAVARMKSNVLCLFAIVGYI